MKFDEKVYHVISRIPKGKISTYCDVACAIGTKAYRAVGQALKRNPDDPRVPCHRVISSSGKLGGYSGKNGIKGKIKLLKKEGVEIIDGRIDLKKYFYRLRK